MVDHIKLLKQAIKLAEKGKGLVSPNPMVGAIIVQKSKIVGSGYHQCFGMPHAEVEAIKKAGKNTIGATLYVNLEPCCHWGKTPPCTEKIISSGIKEVISCMKDPNPIVNGNGFKILQENGIKVRLFPVEGAFQLNQPYITYITKKRPYIILKWAQTIDGKIATKTGDSKWITGEKARKFVREKRFEIDGIVVGINTVLADNPFLDYIPPQFEVKKKLLERKRYYKIIIDPHLKTPLESNIWKNEKSKVLIFISDKVDKEKISFYHQKKENFEFVCLSTENGKFKIDEFLGQLYKKEIGIIMVEGGKNVLTWFFENRKVDEFLIFIGNKIIGGENSINVIGGKDIEKISESFYLENRKIEFFDDDILIRGKVCFQE
ncbi:MAG TPA: bifunctional diaminohydroxyphosphoribosylaminopyrimidine deaminase/5-amino-6-(5-phosphoribosylamino)uracil reductase RibD [bacterium]|nr:bifunctional diaminohydroxyphosphoribosylaminopyrimidine deaminase/5-amino-6-(5-phosphoribosylamino)uracil reductase RibD [bacterium]